MLSSIQNQIQQNDMHIASSVLCDNELKALLNRSPIPTESVATGSRVRHAYYS